MFTILENLTLKICEYLSDSFDCAVITCTNPWVSGYVAQATLPSTSHTSINPTLSPGITLPCLSLSLIIITLLLLVRLPWGTLNLLTLSQASASARPFAYALAVLAVTAVVAVQLTGPAVP